MTITCPILLTKGNTPLITDSLVDQNGAPVDLTGCTLQFAFQGAAYQFVHSATIPSPTTGAVSYQFAGGETNVAGDYIAQWIVTKPDATAVIYPYPGGTIPFKIIEAVPQASPSNIILLRQMYEPVRVTLGDFNAAFRKYADEAIDAVLRTCLLAGKIPGQTLGADRVSISPGIITPCDMAKLMYQAAKMFLVPDLAEYRYETRALSERFGRQESFYFELSNQLYYLENGDMFCSFQSFYAWVNALTGIDIWSVLSDMNTSAPVATVNIGRAGVTVSTG